jgi:hypothetical protein
MPGYCFANGSNGFGFGRKSIISPRSPFRGTGNLSQGGFYRKHPRLEASRPLFEKRGIARREKFPFIYEGVPNEVRRGSKINKEVLSSKMRGFVVRSLKMG